MCVVSVVNDYMRTNVPYPPITVSLWGQQPVPSWTRDTFEEYKEIIRRLGELDKKLAQPECFDAEKSEWMNEVERRLQVLEAEV
jgi:hypothetical protein